VCLGNALTRVPYHFVLNETAVRAVEFSVGAHLLRQLLAASIERHVAKKERRTNMDMKGGCVPVTHAELSTGSFKGIASFHGG
jgi:hypothetical protein